MKKLTLSTFLLGTSLSLSGYAGNADLSCDSKQQFCNIEAPRLTVGDQVGFFNEHQELTAVGKVERIKGSERRVKIISQTGRISSESTYAMIDDNQSQNLEKNYTLYKKADKFAIGGDLGLASVGVGEGGSGLVAGASAAIQVYDLLYLGGRLGFLTASGSAIDTYSKERDSAQFKVQSILLLPTAQLHFPNRGPVNARFELGLGVASTTVSAEETTSNNKQELLDRLSDGWGLGLRGAFGVYSNFSGWTPGVEVSLNQIQNTSFRAISLTIGHSL